MNSRDSRQLKHMLDVTAAVRARAVTLASAADALLFLRDAIDSLDPDLGSELTEHILTLESAGIGLNGSVLERGEALDALGRVSLGEEYPRFVIDALDEVDGVVNRIFSAHPDFETDED